MKQKALSPQLRRQLKDTTAEHNLKFMKNSQWY